MLRKTLKTAFLVSALSIVLLLIANTFSTYHNSNSRSQIGKWTKQFAARMEVNLSTNPNAIQQQNYSPKPTANWNVALVKTHKCASDLMSSILLRLADEKHLELLLPLDKSSNVGYPLKKIKGRPSLRKDSKYQVMALHSMYNYGEWRSLLTGGSVLIGMARHPFEQFESFFYYYLVAQSIRSAFSNKLGMEDASDQDVFEFFIRNWKNLTMGPWKHWKSRYVYKAALRNTMLFDYGAAQTSNPNLVNEILQNFTVILIKEHLDESLYVLKTLLNWDIRDILYQSKNVGFTKVNTKNSKNNKDRLMLARLHTLQSPQDYLFYRKSLEKLDQQKASIDKFRQKVQEFQAMNLIAKEWCDRKLEQRSIDLLSNSLDLFKNYSISFSDAIEMRSKYSDETVIVDLNLCIKLKTNVLNYVDYHVEKYEGHKRTQHFNYTFDET